MNRSVMLYGENMNDKAIFALEKLLLSMMYMFTEHCYILKPIPIQLLCSTWPCGNQFPADR